MKGQYALLLGLFGLVTPTTQAQELSKGAFCLMDAVRATTPPTIDGELDDPTWTSLTQYSGFWDRTKETQAIDQTRFAVCYDDKYIYAAFWCSDSQPSLIHAIETTEDHRWASDNPLTEDHVDLRLDPFRTGSGSELSMFSVNAIGTKSARIAGGRAKKREWSGDWIAKVKRTPSGFQAEIAIPWAILNYPRSDIPVDFGINCFRFQHRTQIHSCWSNVGPEMYNDRHGCWKGVKPPRPPAPKISLLLYALIGVSEDSNVTLKTGMDARYPVTPELTVVGSVNPDFGTIEGAVESIGFTRGQRFVPDRRPFFLEGADFINSGEFHQIARLFYAPSIKSFDVGAKIYGKISPDNTIGFLGTHDFDGRSDYAFKLSHLISPTSRITGFVGGRETDGDVNRVGSISGSARFGKLSPDFIGVTTSGNGQNGDGYQLGLSYNDSPYFTYFSYRHVDEDFRVANGFVSFSGYRGPGLYQSYQPEYRSGPIRSLNVEIDTTLWDQIGGGTYFHTASAFSSVTFRNDDHVSLGYVSGRFIDERDDFVTASFQRGRTNRHKRYGIEYQKGIVSNEPYEFLGPFGSFRIGKSLDVSYQAAFQSLLGHQQQQILTANYEFSPTEALGGRIVKEDDDWNGYVSYRNSGKKGTEMFVILGDPNARKFKKILQFKFVFAI